MNKVTFSLLFIAIIATYCTAKRTVNGVPVLINQYQYEIPTHYTPLKAKYDLPYPYLYPYPLGIPKVIEDLPEVIEIVIPAAPPKPHENYGVPNLDIIISKDAPAEAKPEEKSSPLEKVKNEPITTNYKFAVPSKEEPVSEPNCGDDILIPAEPAPTHAEKIQPVLTSYQFQIPSSTALPKPALEYGVPDIFISEEKPTPAAAEKPALVHSVPETVASKEKLAPAVPGKPALVYGVPDNLPIVEDY
ncbi:hypothetical protein Trydic_g16849 [Trypoxylus dichotomus]